MALETINSSYLDNSLESRVVTVEDFNGLKGLLIGGIEFDTLTTVPNILVGTYHVNDRTLSVDSEIATALTADYGNGVLEADNWYGLYLKSDGTSMFHLESGTQIIGGLAISSITDQGGNTFRYAFSGSPNLATVAVGDHFQVSGCDNSDNDGVFVITAISDANDTIDVTNANGVAQGTAGGTGIAHLPVGDISGGGTGVGVAFPNPLFNGATRNYYSRWLSYEYRMLGCFYVDTSNNVIHVVSFDHGRKKNNGIFAAHTYSGYGSTNDKIVEFLTVLQNWGEGDLWNYDTADGDKWTFIKSGKINISGFMQSATNNVKWVGVTNTSSELTTSIEATTARDKILGLQSDPGISGQTITSEYSCNSNIKKDDVIRVHSDGDTPPTVDKCQINFIFNEN